MKSLNEINKIADRFEYKLKKYAQSQEADSSELSIMILEPIKSSLIGFNLENKLALELGAKRDSEWEKGNEIRGYIRIGDGGTLTAHRDASGWIIDEVSLKKDGDLLENPLMKPIIEKLYNEYIPSLKTHIKRKLDEYSSKENRWASYTKITNYIMPNETHKAHVEL